MRAVVIGRPGDPDVLELRRVAQPQPLPDEVRVRVRATAVNRADLLQRRGLYPAPPDAPADIPGLEFAGEVELCGERVRRLQRGDRVMGILGGGGYAEKVTVHEQLCMRIPPGMEWEAAAAVPEAFLTAYEGLFRHGTLAVGEAVLIQAAGSGVGTAAVQLGLAAGCRVFATTRSADKRRRLEQLGRLHVFDPARPDLAQAIALASGGEGVDVVLDLVGACAWPLHAEVLRSRGRLVLIGLLGGARAQLDLALILRKRLTLVGSVMRSRTIAEKIALVQDFSGRILPLLAAGRVSPLVHCALDLTQAAEAHALLEHNENFGKVVLRV